MFCFSDLRIQCVCVCVCVVWGLLDLQTQLYMVYSAVLLQFSSR